MLLCFGGCCRVSVGSTVWGFGATFVGDGKGFRMLFRAGFLHRHGRQGFRVPRSETQQNLQSHVKLTRPLAPAPRMFGQVLLGHGRKALL